MRLRAPADFASMSPAPVTGGSGSGPDVQALRATLDGTMVRDRRGLLRSLEKLAGRESADPRALQEWQRRAEAARARHTARAARVPAIRVDEALPIAARADEIVALIRKHQVIVLAGETGSGKTTQLPKLCLAAGRGVAGLIGCTQPRRIAARTVARRVAAELDTTLGDLVGFQVRFNDQVSDQSLIKFMTDGILLAETQGDPWLNGYDTIILDEAHERSLNIDFLLGYLKRLLARRPDLKLIVTSATIDTARFASHFGDAPVVEVEGRTFPVEVRWRPDDGSDADARTAPPGRGARPHRSPEAGRGDRGESGLVERIVAAVDEITREDPRGDVLVFLAGEREIRDAHLALSRRKYRETEVLALYARLSAAEQDRVFRPGPQRRIVLATNVAETSVTVPRIRYVVDPGTARVKRYSHRNQLERLHVEPISQAAADQRKGRCGRVAAGVCVRLYSEEDYSLRDRYTEPEILRSSLAGVILRMLSLKLGEVADFPFVDAPTERAIGDGYRRLTELAAVDADRRLTAIGSVLAKLPIDVALGRMLVEAEKRGALRELLILAAFLSVQDPRERPADARPQADAAHAEFIDARSDFIGVLNLWSAYSGAHADLTQSKLRDWCQARFLSFMRMREWRELHRQLLLASADLGWSVTTPDADAATAAAPAPSRPQPARAGRGPQRRARADGRRDAASTPHVPGGAMNGTSPAHAAGSAAADSLAGAFDAPRYEAIHRCLLSGWPTQVGLKNVPAGPKPPAGSKAPPASRDERNLYRGTRERKFSIFPGSALARSPPQWLLAGQILDVQKVYALSCARVEPAWIEQQAAHLVKRSWHDAHWSRKRGAVVAFEQVTLFGLTLVEKRPVQFGSQEPELAHRIFVGEALARGEIDARADFVRANARVLGEARELEAQRRRSGLLRSDEELAAFFIGKLPSHIHSSAALDAWYRTASPLEQAALHWSLADVSTDVPGVGVRDFPTELEVASHALRLTYRFVPGDPADGVTLHVPLALVNAVSAARCEWLVPGLLVEKVAESIRALPKSLRRNFVPAPDFARAFADSEPPRDEPLHVVLARYLQRVTGVVVGAADFAGPGLPAHLSMNFRIFEEQGKGKATTLVESRDLAAIQAQWTGAARVAFSRRADVDLTREDVAAFDFDDIPDSIVSSGGLTAFPALVDLGESVALRVFERHDEALREHRRGVERLLRRALADRLKQARRQMPLNSALALKWTPLGSADSLRADLAEAALRERLAVHELDIRGRAAFEHAKDVLAREIFPAAVDRLAVAESIIAAYAELRPTLEAPLLGFARANYDDLREQLAELLAPGFLRHVDASRLSQFPRYLKAMRLRAERLRQDPSKDQARMLALQGYWRDYLKLRAERGGDESELEELRWLIEELRVSTFAQELRTSAPVSPKRVAKIVEELRRS